jgi:hypothetical protein
MNRSLSALEHLLLIVIDMKAEDIRDYVKVADLQFHFNSLQELASTLNSCVEKHLIVLSNFSDFVPGKGSEVAMTESGIRECIARKAYLGIRYQDLP